MSSAAFHTIAPKVTRAHREFYSKIQFSIFSRCLFSFPFILLIFRYMLNETFIFSFESAGSALQNPSLNAEHGGRDAGKLTSALSLSELQNSTRGET